MKIQLKLEPIISLSDLQRGSESQESLGTDVLIGLK